MDSLEKYISKVDEIATDLYEIGWKDIASDEEELDKCRLQGETPKEFVLGKGEKYGLTKV